MNDENMFLQAEDLCKSFRIGSRRIPVLKGVSFSVTRGDWVALYGASGSGKTTLLDILGTLSRPDSGRVLIDGTDPASLSARALVAFRRKNIGFVFQSYHILPELNILENVMLPSRLDGMPFKAARARAAELLESVGLAGRMDHRPGELSGGEQQRAAVARALMNRPALLLADEPTGNLDSETGRGILKLFLRVRQESNTTIIMVTHDRGVASLAGHVVELRDGVVSQNEQKEEMKP
ncbi:MAG: ABC transporter ATP-binding protein [Lentisphaeria bacterium]|nr:ABC transporter ATP-binding protein [Lentisphaeria bacterium]